MELEYRMTLDYVCRVDIIPNVQRDRRYVPIGDSASMLLKTYEHIR